MLDSGDLFEPDLIAVGHESITAEFSSISASFVAPSGFLDDVGCLVLSSTRVGSFCTIGRFATVQAGGRVPQGHSIRPYGTLSQYAALITGDMADKYPHFYAETHLRVDGAIFAALLLYMALLPAGTASLILFKITTYLAGLRGPSLPGAVLTVVMHGSACELLLSALCGIASATIFAPIASIVLSYVVFIYKRYVMGPLAPGMNLLSSDGLLFKYCLFRRMLEYPFFNAAAIAAKLGANVTSTSQIVSGISEFDAVSLGPYTSAGGATSFKNVDLEGDIHPITIAAGVNSGHTTFFPGCVVEEGVQVGNETSVPMEHTVPRDHQLQVCLNLSSQNKNQLSMSYYSLNFLLLFFAGR